MNIGVFGGTFDPIHEGHLLIAKTARKQFGLDKVLFIPAFIPPHKSHERDLTPAPYRYEMVKLAIHGEDGFEVSDVEWNRPEISYTVQTLRQLKEEYPKDKLFFILGGDSLAALPAWREPDEILRLAHILVAPRSGQDPVLPKGAGLIQMPQVPMASTEIRRLLKEKKPVPAGFLPPAISDYIAQKKLYTGSACRPS